MDPRVLGSGETVPSWVYDLVDSLQEETQHSLSPLGQAEDSSINDTFRDRGLNLIGGGEEPGLLSSLPPSLV